jgi:hypothetical protein
MMIVTRRVHNGKRDGFARRRTDGTAAPRHAEAADLV